MASRSNTSRVWFVTGASSGFGRALTVGALNSGARVVAAARNPDLVADLEARYPEMVLPVRLDVTDASQAKDAVHAGVRAFGRLDVVANIAGYGVFGAFEELSDEDLRRQMEVNLFGSLHVTRAALPVLRTQRSGHVIQMSSLSGVAPAVAGESVYAASKFAVEGWCEVLSKEVAHLGIKVTIVEPGPFRTTFGAGASVTPVGHSDYDPSVGEALRWFAKLEGQQPNDPSRGAAAILDIVDADAPPLRLPLGPEAVTAISEKLQAQEAQLRDWEHLSAATHFDHT
jgi:NAD(P)-dependent dehydrogenase (short-subunit alcohol dehydrogenase family)